MPGFISFSRQFANSQVFELHRRALRLETKIAESRLAAAPAGYLLAVYPQPYLAVDRAHIVMVPLTGALAQALAGKAAHPVRRRERFHLGSLRRENVAMGRKPVR